MVSRDKKAVLTQESEPDSDDFQGAIIKEGALYEVYERVSVQVQLDDLLLVERLNVEEKVFTRLFLGLPVLSGIVKRLIGLARIFELLDQRDRDNPIHIKIMVGVKDNRHASNLLLLPLPGLLLIVTF